MVPQIKLYVINTRIKLLEILRKIGLIINVLNAIIGKAVKHYHHKAGICTNISAINIYIYTIYKINLIYKI